MGGQWLVVMDTGLKFHVMPIDRVWWQGNLMMTIVVIPIERAIIKREYLNGMYCLRSYWIARVLQAVLQAFLCQAVTAPIGYFLLGLPSELYRFAAYYLTLSLLASLASISALVIGCSVPNAQSAVQKVSRGD